MGKPKNDTGNFKGFETRPDLQNELINTAPRAAVLVAAAALEVTLTRILEAFLIADDKEVKILMASENATAPFGTFGARIRGCYCLG